MRQGLGCDFDRLQEPGTTTTRSGSSPNTRMFGTGTATNTGTSWTMWSSRVRSCWRRPAARAWRAAMRSREKSPARPRPGAVTPSRRDRYPPSHGCRPAPERGALHGPRDGRRGDEARCRQLAPVAAPDGGGAAAVPACPGDWPRPTGRCGGVPGPVSPDGASRGGNPSGTGGMRRQYIEDGHHPNLHAACGAADRPG